MCPAAQRVTASLKQFSPRFSSCFPEISLIRCRTQTSQASGRRCCHDWPGSASGPGRAGGPRGAAAAAVGVRATASACEPKQRRLAASCSCWLSFFHSFPCFFPIHLKFSLQNSNSLQLSFSHLSIIDSSQQGIAAQCGLIMVSTAAFDFCRGGNLLYHGLST